MREEGDERSEAPSEMTGATRNDDGTTVISQRTTSADGGKTDRTDKTDKSTSGIKSEDAREMDSKAQTKEETIKDDTGKNRLFEYFMCCREEFIATKPNGYIPSSNSTTCLKFVHKSIMYDRRNVYLFIMNLARVQSSALVLLLMYRLNMLLLVFV